MIKKMLINAGHLEECRVAVVTDGLLEELDVHVNTREATLGDIFKGVVTRIEPSLQAVFVDYGSQRNGFLSINDVHPSYFPESFEAGRKRPRIQEVFKRGDEVIVQVNKEERDNKGASLTTNISIAGRYLVLMPGTDLCGVSRKIEEEKERKKLKEILKQLKPPRNMGFIIRTAGLGRSKTELSRDLNYLLKLWEAIEKTMSGSEAPALLYHEQDVVIRSIKEHFSPDISEILVDDKEVYNKAREFFRQVMPKYENLVKMSQEKRPLFNKYQLEDQIEQAYGKKIRLKSGGCIVIEPTEAMVTVDVNSGSATKEKGIEETAFRVNMEAAVEIARQLRLRDLGGIIVIDFIDMVHKKHKQEVEKTLRAELKKDRAKTKVVRISALGCLELSRQRLKSSLGTGEYLDCPHCNGSGKIKSPEMVAVSVFRKVKSQLIRGAVAEVKATVPARAADYLLNKMRAQLAELERQYSSRITIQVNQNIPDKDITVEAVKQEPVEQVITELPRLEEAGVDLVASEDVESHEETSPDIEADKGHPRRTGRRRRRSKKRLPLEAAEEPLASESPEESALEEAIWTAGSGGTNFQERLLEEACETLDLFSRDLTVDEPTEPAVDQPQHGSSQLDDEQAEPMEIRTDQQDASPAQRDSSEQSTQRGTGKRRGQTRTGERKTTLQSYLPFS